MQTHDERAPLRRFGRVATVAKVIDCSVSTVWRLAAAGKIPRPQRFGNLTLWDLDAVAAAIERGLKP